MPASTKISDLNNHCEILGDVPRGSGIALDVMKSTAGRSRFAGQGDTAIAARRATAPTATSVSMSNLACEFDRMKQVVACHFR